ncbi:MAG: hypothetical protein AAGJ10_07650 [Bacteroidota bacterium]
MKRLDANTSPSPASPGTRPPSETVRQEVESLRAMMGLPLGDGHSLPSKPDPATSAHSTSTASQ